MLKKYKPYVLLLLIIAIGAFLRFYKLDWGQGLFTHPDEYHIATSVNQLSFPNQMHPHFFSYGTVTIYLIYFTQELIKSISQILNSEFLIFNSFIVGRLYSALFSTLTIFVVYGISRTFLNTKLSLLAAFLVALTPGLIQHAHFSTPESALIFFLFGSLLFLIKFIQLYKIFYLILASVLLGFALGVKISSVVFLLPLIVSIAFGVFSKHRLRGARSGLHACRAGELLRDAPSGASLRPLLGGGEATTSTPPRWMLRKSKLILKLLLRSVGLTLASLIVTIATFALAAPYVFLDFPAFRSNLEYESSLAIGKIPIFYTRQFIDTIPVIFQAEKILPYALGHAIFALGAAGFVFVMLNLVQHLFHPLPSRERVRVRGEIPKQVRNDMKRNILFIIAFLSLFLPNAFLFTKWTRFIAPTFPFFAIFAAFFLQRFEKSRIVFYSLLMILLGSTTLWTTAFFSIYVNPDIRITASGWLESNVKGGSVFLVEGGNMVDLPLQGNFAKISLNFYNLEDNPLVRQQVADALYASDYFLVQSRRVFMNHQRLPHLYPKTARFYNALFNGKLGFEQIKEFHSYPKLEVLSYKLEVPDESAEETWSVFDHPVIRVFKKNSSFTREDYARLLES